MPATLLKPASCILCKLYSLILMKVVVSNKRQRFLLENMVFFFFRGSTRFLLNFICKNFNCKSALWDSFCVNSTTVVVPVQWEQGKGNTTCCKDDRKEPIPTFHLTYSSSNLHFLGMSSALYDCVGALLYRPNPKLYKWKMQWIWKAVWTWVTFWPAIIIIHSCQVWHFLVTARFTF